MSKNRNRQLHKVNAEPLNTENQNNENQALLQPSGQYEFITKLHLNFLQIMLKCIVIL